MTVFFWCFLLAFSSALGSSLFKELHQMVEHCFCWTDAEVQKCCHLRGPAHFRRLSTIVSSQRVFRVTTSGMICSFGGVLPNFFLSTSSVTKGNLWDRGSIAIMDDGHNQSGVSMFSLFFSLLLFCITWSLILLQPSRWLRRWPSRIVTYKVFCRASVWFFAFVMTWTTYHIIDLLHVPNPIRLT